jgi:hypothetical protein
MVPPMGLLNGAMRRLSLFVGSSLEWTGAMDNGFGTHPRHCSWAPLPGGLSMALGGSGAGLEIFLLRLLRQRFFTGIIEGFALQKV